MEQQNPYPQQGSPAYNPQYQPYYPQPPKKKVSPVLWILVAVLAVIVIVCGTVLLLDNSFEEAELYLDEPCIARIFVEGTISGEVNGDYDQEFLLTTIDELIEDPNNLALIVYCDSPGGEVLACDELSRKIEEYQEATGRPVYAYGHNMMASAAYWIACTADYVAANRYCVTGSIGVTYGSMLDISGLLDKYGIRVNTIASGEQKSMGNLLEPMSDEARRIFQTIIAEYYGYFLDWIDDHRELDREQVRALADGRIYTASQAAANGLIDAVGTYDGLLDALTDELGWDAPVQDYHSPVEFSIWDELSWLQYGNAGGTDMAALMDRLGRVGPLAYYDGAL